MRDSALAVKPGGVRDPPHDRAGRAVLERLLQLLLAVFATAQRQLVERNGHCGQHILVLLLLQAGGRQALAVDENAEFAVGGGGHEHRRVGAAVGGAEAKSGHLVRRLEVKVEGQQGQQKQQKQQKQQGQQGQQHEHQ